MAQNSQLNSKIDPLKSNGYMYWEDISSDEYLIEIEQEDINGILTPIKSFIIKDNWFKLDNDILDIPNAHITVNSYENGVITDHGDAIITVPPWHIDDSLICEVDCNGTNTSYAYKLQIWENANGESSMIANPTYDYYDPIEHIYTPYYQAISTPVWESLADNHPYKITGQTGTPLYEKETILSNNPNTYFDLMNNVVTSGVLVEKKMDQYSVYQSVGTTAEPSYNLCTQQVNTSATWVDFFNLYHNQNHVFPPQYPSYFGTVSELGCAEATVYGGGSPYTGGSSGNFDDMFDELDILHPCLVDATSFQETIGCHNDFFNNQSNIALGVNGVQITPLSNHNQVYEIFLQDNGEITNNINPGDLVTGLYKFTVFTNTGGIYSRYKTLVAEQDRPDYTTVKMLIVPNPITNSVLNIDIESEYENDAVIHVYTLDGTILNTVNVNLQSGSTHNETMNIPTGLSIPQNQIRILLILEDGTALSQTAAFIR